MTQRLDTDAAEVVFLFIGGAHQVFHLAPVAAELVCLLPNRSVVCLSGDDTTTAALHLVRETMGTPGLHIENIRVPSWGRLLSAATGRKSTIKWPLLFSLRQRLGQTAAVITPERTSSVLRKMGLRRTLMIHFRHGAGDRASHTERRLAAFDIVAVPGEKDLRRAIDACLLPKERLRLCGYVKLDFCRRLARERLSIFGNDRPTVLYNPHFDRRTSSLRVAEQLVARFGEQSRYNLIFAPHIRATENMDAVRRSHWQGLAVPGRIFVDLNSPRLFDMTYVFGADIYLGDMSSQLYEFLTVPRPVAFMNAHGVAWRENPRYAGWHLGEVADHLDDVINAVDRAVAGHWAMIHKQKAAVENAFGDIDGSAARGACIIAEALSAGTPR